MTYSSTKLKLLSGQASQSHRLAFQVKKQEHMDYHLGRMAVHLDAYHEYVLTLKEACKA